MSNGSVGLDMLDQQNFICYAVEFIADNGNYFVSFSDWSEEKACIKTYFNPDGEPEQVTFSGNLWDRRTIFNDFDFVLSVFKEFFETGTVVKNKLK
jgi:hypothetical protein